MEEFKCSLCKIQYSQANPPRLLTMCGHTYCHHCIKTIIKRKDYRYMVRCPDDRLTISVETNSPSHFPKNIVLLQAIRKQGKIKEKEDHENNQFIPDNHVNLKKSTILSESRGSLVELKEGLLGYRRMSLQEGICLLHRKPLDIVCIEEKIHICAECALFGLHKGHNFTTLKELFQKNKEWSHNITEIIEQKKHIDTKILNGQIQKEVSSILNKKKDLLNDEIDCYIKRIKQKINLIQKSMKQELNHKMVNLQQELKLIMAIDPHLEEGFMSWTSKVYQKCHQLQQFTNDTRIIIIDHQDEDLLKEGNLMLQNMKNELIRYWSKIQTVLEYPKLIYSQQIEKNLHNLIKFQLFQQQSMKNQELLSMDITKLEDQSMMEVKKDVPIFDQISLLDISSGFKYQESETANINLSQISFVNEPIEFKSAQNLEKSDILPQVRMKRAKSKGELNLNMSLINNSEKRVNIKSPKDKLKTQIFSKKNISSPTSPKVKLRKFVLKVKEPQKFQKVINSLQADNIDSIDLTGFDIGDEVAKQLCLKIQECKKPKMLRLMKNSLTDESLKEVIDTLKVIDYLNLAQNGFTEKAFDLILELGKNGQLKKGKTIQLGQNRLNSRKLKGKIDELKLMGVIITL